MTRSGLRDYDGCTVEIIADSKPVLADLHSADAAEAHLTIPADHWTPAGRYYLSDAEIATISVKSGRTLIGNISVRSDRS